MCKPFGATRIVVFLIHTHAFTQRRSDTPYALHICVRNRPEIERDPFLAVHVKSNQLWTQAGKKVSLTGIFTNFFYFILFFLVGHTAERSCSFTAYAGMKMLCV